MSNRCNSTASGWRLLSLLLLDLSSIARAISALILLVSVVVDTALSRIEIRDTSFPLNLGNAQTTANDSHEVYSLSLKDLGPRRRRSTKFLCFIRG